MKCPKCRGNSFELYELLECAHVYTVENGKHLAMYVSQEMPATIGFSAKCICGHQWTPRYKSASKVMNACCEENGTLGFDE